MNLYYYILKLVRYNEARAIASSSRNVRNANFVPSPLTAQFVKFSTFELMKLQLFWI